MRGWDWLLKTCKTWLMASLPDLPQLAAFLQFSRNIFRLSMSTDHHLKDHQTHSCGLIVTGWHTVGVKMYNIGIPSHSSTSHLKIDTG